MSVIENRAPISFFGGLRNSKGSDTHPQSEQDDEGSGALPVDPLASRRPPRKTAAERKAILDSDSRVAIVKSDEVKCQNCKKWIRLSTKLEYALANWNRHALICHDAVYVFNVDSANSCLTTVVCNTGRAAVLRPPQENYILSTILKPSLSVFLV